MDLAYPDDIVALVEEDALPAPESVDPVAKLLALAETEGDISHAWTENDLTLLGQEVVADFDQDLRDRADWEKIVVKAQEAAAQEKVSEKTYPWAKASNVNYPLLTVAALQFNARAYPAIVKGDEAVSVKIVGADKGRPAVGADGVPLVSVNGQPIPMPMAQQAMAQAQAMGQQAAVEPLWEAEPGAKARRASRVRDYMNTVLFYRIDDWEQDTDALLMDLPIVGCAFRKVWWANGEPNAKMVPALRLVVPMGATSLASAPRVTEVLEDVYPHVIRQRQRAGVYRDVELQAENEDKAKPRKLLEQHRLIDLDEDGLEEPYVITVDYETRQVLRIEPNFSTRDVQVNDAGEALSIKAGCFYVKYDFFPHPQGKFYGIGLGHLLDQIGGVINTAINQLMDAGHAQIAGGGFIASGVRLQAAGRQSTLRFRPGEYKTVEGVSGAALRDAFYERTLPNPSPVMVNILDMMLAASRDISSVKDVVTGEASNTGQVGTTLALIEQGLQVFTAVYKRVYRALRQEYQLLFDNIAKYGGEAAAADYAEVLDDPQADFAADFDADDMDIRPVSDPSSVTRMQKMAKAQALLQIGNQNPIYDQYELHRRVNEAMDTEDIDTLLVKPQPAQPGPDVIAKANRDQAAADKDSATAAKTELETATMAYAAGVQMGAASDDQPGGISGLGGGPSDQMGPPGGQGLPAGAA